MAGRDDRNAGGGQRAELGILRTLMRPAAWPRVEGDGYLCCAALGAAAVAFGTGVALFVAGCQTIALGGAELNGHSAIKVLVFGALLSSIVLGVGVATLVDDERPPRDD